ALPAGGVALFDLVARGGELGLGLGGPGALLFDLLPELLGLRLGHAAAALGLGDGGGAGVLRFDAAPLALLTLGAEPLQLVALLLDLRLARRDHVRGEASLVALALEALLQSVDLRRHRGLAGSLALLDHVQRHLLILDLAAELLELDAGGAALRERGLVTPQQLVAGLFGRDAGGAVLVEAAAELRLGRGDLLAEPLQLRLFGLPIRRLRLELAAQ